MSEIYPIGTRGYRTPVRPVSPLSSEQGPRDPTGGSYSDAEAEQRRAEVYGWLLEGANPRPSEVIFTLKPGRFKPRGIEFGQCLDPESKTRVMKKSGLGGNVDRTV